MTHGHPFSYTAISYPFLPVILDIFYFHHRKIAPAASIYPAISQVLYFTHLSVAKKSRGKVMITNAEKRTI